MAGGSRRERAKQILRRVGITPAKSKTQESSPKYGAVSSLVSSLANISQDGPPSATDAAIPTVPERLRNEAYGSTPASNNASTTSFDRHNLVETKESGRAPHTGSAKQSSKRALWDQAVTLLQESQEDPAIVGIVKEFTSNPTASPDGSPDSVKCLAKDITEEMEREIKRQPQDDHRHHVVEKTISILNKFIAVGDVVVSFDPVHAALPWAAVRFVLVTLTASSELKNQLLGGIAKVTSLVLQCHTYRRLYIESDPTLQPPENALSALETSIVQAYAKSLLFLGFAIQRQRSRSRFIDAPFKQGDIDMYAGGLQESGSRLVQAADDCEKHCNLSNRSTVNELYNVAKELRQAILDQTDLVLKIHQDFVLAKLRTAEGAAFDHRDQEHEAKCHPRTRVALLDEISTWASNSESDRIFWLQGMAGTGKSTISRTVARMLAESGALGASFFFKRGEVDRNSAARFFTTIASQLVRRLPALAQHIKEVIETDPGIGEKYLTVQFEKLILQPLKRLDHDRTSSETVVIVIDALDECDPESHATAIIGLLPQAKQLSSISLKFFVTSRPEFPILSEFRKISGAYQDLILHNVDEHIVEKDLSVYFDSELSKIRDDYNKACPNWPLSSDWPGQSNLQILVKRAVPLFIFAKTVCLFVQDRKRGDPKTLLDKILRYQTKGQEFRLHGTYLPILNQMLAGEDQEAIVEEFCEIVGALVILADPLSVKALARLLGIEEQIIGHRLSLLNSVLNIPSDVTAPVKTLHLSFRDFLVDPKNRATNPFWVDEEMTHGKLVTKCLKRLRDCLQEDICSLQWPGKSRAEVNGQIFLERLPSEIQYACLYWVYHLKRSRRTVRDGDKVHYFLTRYFLNWLEALSLIGRISESIGLIDDLQSVTDPETGVNISRFLHDAKRFILNCRSAIEEAPLQIYSSALVFAPEKSLIRETFQYTISSWIITKPIIESNWSPCIQTLEGHSHRVASVAFSPDSKYVASASDDKTVKIWDAATGQEIRTLEGHSDWVRSVAFSADSKYVASGSDDKTVKIWDIATGQEIQTLKGHSYFIKSVAFSADSKYVASGSDDKTVKIWDAAAGQEIWTLEGHTDSVTSIAFSADSKCVASGSNDKTVKIWDAATGQEIRTLEGHSDDVNSVTFSADSKYVASGSDDRTVKIWDAATGQEIRTLEGHTDFVTSVAFSADSKCVASGSNDKTVKIWDAATGQEIRTLEGHSNDVSSVTFSADSKYVASGSDDRTVKIWDAATGQEIRTLEGHSGWVISVVFSADSKYIASGSADKTVKIWDAATGQEIRTLKGHSYWVGSVAFSADSKYVASGSDDRTVKIWDAATGQEIRTLEGHTDFVTSVAFSADSKYVTSGSNDKTVKIWEAATGACLQTLHIGRALNDISFDPTSLFLYTEIGVLALVVNINPDPKPNSNPPSTLSSSHTASNLSTTSSSSEPQTSGLGLRPDGTWITWNARNLLRLPPDYRANRSAVAASTVAIGCRSGRVFIIRFDGERLSKF